MAWVESCLLRLFIIVGVPRVPVPNLRLDQIGGRVERSSQIKAKVSDFLNNSIFCTWGQTESEASKYTYYIDALIICLDRSADFEIIPPRPDFLLPSFSQTVTRACFIPMND